MLQESSSNLPYQAQPINQNLADQIEAENKVVSFTSEMFGDVAVLMIENEPWFIAKQVSERLGYPNAYDAVRDLCPRKKTISYKQLKQLQLKTGPNPVLEISSFRTGCIIISLSDLFALIDKSTKPEAQVMKDWINKHILPAVYQTGSYTMVTHPAAKQQISAETQLLAQMVQSVSQVLASVVETNAKMLDRLDNLDQRMNASTLLLQSTIKEHTPQTEESRWARQNSGPFNTSAIAKKLRTTPPRLNQVMHNLGLIYLHPNGKYWLMTAKGADFSFHKAKSSWAKRYVNHLRWDGSVVEYLKRTAPEFQQA